MVHHCLFERNFYQIFVFDGEDFQKSLLLTKVNDVFFILLSLSMDNTTNLKVAQSSLHNSYNTKWNNKLFVWLFVHSLQKLK